MDRRFYSNDTTTSDLASIPTTQASGITWVSWNSNQIKINFTRGDGESISTPALNDGAVLTTDAYPLLLVKQSTTLTEEPSDGQQYTGSINYGQGDRIGDAYVLAPIAYNGLVWSWQANSLTANTSYCFRIFEYNGSGSTTRYLKTTATNNPRTRKTTF